MSLTAAADDKKADKPLLMNQEALLQMMQKLQSIGPEGSRDMFQKYLAAARGDPTLADRPPSRKDKKLARKRAKQRKAKSAASRVQVVE